MYCIINTCVCLQERQGLIEKSKLSPVVYLKKYDDKAIYKLTVSAGLRYWGKTRHEDQTSVRKG